MKKYLLTVVLFLALTPLVSFGAIVRDNQSPTGNNYNNPINGATVPFTVTSTINRILIVGSFGAPGSDTITGITFAGVPMTKIAAAPAGGADNRYSTLWYLVAPATGTNNIVISASGGDGDFAAVSYTGVSQTNPINAFTTSTANPSPGSQVTTSLTTQKDNSWTIIGARVDAGTVTAGTGSTLVVQDTAGYGMYDSNAPITPAQSYSMQIGSSVNGANFGIVMAALSPFVPGGGTTCHIRGKGLCH